MSNATLRVLLVAVVTACVCVLSLRSWSRADLSAINAQPLQERSLSVESGR